MKKFNNFLCASMALLFILLPFAQVSLVSASDYDLTILQDPRVSIIGASVSIPSSSPVDFNYLKIINNTSSNIGIEAIKVNRSGGEDANFAKAALYYLNVDNSRGGQIGSDQYFTAGLAYFTGLSLSIPANSSTTIALTAQVNNSTPQSTALGLTVVSGDSIYPVGSHAVAGSAPSFTRTVDRGGADITPPAAPTNVSVIQNGTAQALRLAWTDPADGDLVKINFYRSTVQGQIGSLLYAVNRGLSSSPLT